MLSSYTKRSIKYDLLRLRARISSAFRNSKLPDSDKLHFGCGSRRVDGWLNVDVLDSEWDVDLTAKLPWVDDAFTLIVGQQVIEHLDLIQELPGLLAELKRVLSHGGVLWLACPDMKKICEAYMLDRGQKILSGRMERYPLAWYGRLPSQQIINEFFNQGGEHKNLFDFELLSFLVKQAGFSACFEESEDSFLASVPGFPSRNDNDVSIYVKCVK